MPPVRDTTTGLDQGPHLASWEEEGQNPWLGISDLPKFT